jgi:voltage-gated potassium channel
MSDGWHRLWIGFVLVVGVITTGSVGFHTIGQWNGLDWSWWDCVYLTVITVSTVGYGETLPIRDVYGARGFTIFLILFGMGMLVYFASAVVALVVELNVKDVIRRRARLKAIGNLKDHVIVCGAGTTGIHVVEELRATGTPFIVVESDESRVQHIAAHLGMEFLFVIGDATDDDVLREAGIDRARGIVTALSSDKDNLFVTISARQMNAKLRIIARSREVSAAPKMKRAGADSVVSPNFIGGMRMVSEMIRPEVTEFLDLMLRNKDKTLRIEEAVVLPGSPIENRRLADAEIRLRTELLVIAARRADGSYKYNPGPDFVLAVGTTLIVLGEMRDVIKLRRHIQPA